MGYESSWILMFEIDVSPHTLTSAYGEFLFIKFQLLVAQFARAFIYRYFLCTMILCTM